MDFPGVHRHTPGALSRGAVLDVGLKCPHSCAFCYYSYWDGGPEQFAGLRKACLRGAGDCLEIVREAARFANHLDITGGEPTVHPALPEMVAEAARAGLASRLITLGQFLLRGEGGATLLDKLLDAGLTDLLFSLHAAGPDAFRGACGGSLKKLLRAMDHLDALGFQYGCNTVIMERNRRDLPAIAALAAARGVYVVNFIAFNAYHAWRGQERAAALQASYTAIGPYLAEAVAALDAAGLAANIRYVPLCAFPGLERHVVGVLGVPYDPYEWRNRCLNHDSPPAYCAEPLEIPASGVREIFAFTSRQGESEHGVALHGMRGKGFKLFPAQCRECAALPACDGVDPVYLARHGAGEFKPLDLETRGPLLAARLGYLPPHLMKAAPDADMRGAIRALAGLARTEA